MLLGRIVPSDKSGAIIVKSLRDDIVGNLPHSTDDLWVKTGWHPVLLWLRLRRDVLLMSEIVSFF